ncbi:MFS transporter [Alkalilimnicola ehrlichii]|uniref:Major facilitator superfamily (MFS) profile domain-containing protein n=1 Tax=Alkalilimnicola ehrlichii TaxID=351052 RepID=A0A3E0X2N2_9GAMM|nr:MFS transporter [Alkalilimnicola ehrlichii]RFA38901.1 hypothetical protein CAL65_03095 [Alkalilimnicola ehrlichii]
MHALAHSPRLATAVLAVATGIIVTIEFIVIGLMPVLAGELGVSLSKAGGLVSAFALSAAIAGPVATLLLARLEPRLTLGLMLLIIGVGNLAAALSPSFQAMIAIRLIQGALLTPFIAIASHTVATLAGAGNVGRTIGWLNTGTVIGTVVAVPVGMILAERIGWMLVSSGLGVLALVCASLIFVHVPPLLAASAVSLRAQMRLLACRRFIAHLWLSTALFTAMFAGYSYIVPLLQSVLGLSPNDAAVALFCFGVAGLAGNWLASRHVERTPLAQRY